MAFGIECTAMSLRVTCKCSPNCAASRCNGRRPGVAYGQALGEPTVGPPRMRPCFSLLGSGMPCGPPVWHASQEQIPTPVFQRLRWCLGHPTGDRPLLGPCAPIMHAWSCTMCLHTRLPLVDERCEPTRVDVPPSCSTSTWFLGLADSRHGRYDVARLSLPQVLDWAMHFEAMPAYDGLFYTVL